MSRIKIPALAALAVLAAGVFRVPAQQTNNTSTATDFSSFVKIISDRNIFDPKRVPLRPFVARPAPKIVNYFALYGTFNYHKGMFAVFDGSSPEYHKVTEVGEKIDGYTVTAVEDHSVKLSSGTNEVSLNIGMQMTRSDDGKWTASTAPAPGRNSYASNGRNSGRTDWRSSGGRGSFRRGNSSRDRGNFGQFGQGNFGGGQFPANAFTDPSTTSSGTSSGNLSDVVEMMRQRRLQEMGGADNPPDTGETDAVPPDMTPADATPPDAVPADAGPPGQDQPPQNQDTPNENPNNDVNGNDNNPPNQ